MRPVLSPSLAGAMLDWCCAWALLLATVGCAEPISADNYLFSCTSSSQCGGGKTCVAGSCRLPGAEVASDADIQSGDDTETMELPSACTSAQACDDGNPCTVDSCVPASGCTHSLQAVGSDCGDGRSCDETGVCVQLPTDKRYVPGGQFQMGCAALDSSCDPAEEPQHPETLAAFFIDRQEVTAGAYEKCVLAGSCTAPSTTEDACSGDLATWNSWNGMTGKAKNGRQQFPVNCLTWTQAAAYCAWAGDRLPTEAEWERAARGGLTNQLYPWGSGIDCDHAVFDDGSATDNQGCDANGPIAVGSKPAGINGYGLLDMAGNVAEWVADWYAADYYSSSPAANPSGAATGSMKVLRGSDFGGVSPSMRASVRDIALPTTVSVYNGFRCVRSL